MSTKKKGCNQDEYDKEYEAAGAAHNLKVKCNRLKTKVSSSTASYNSSSSLGMSSQTTKQKLAEIYFRSILEEHEHGLFFIGGAIASVYTIKVEEIIRIASVLWI